MEIIVVRIFNEDDSGVSYEIRDGEGTPLGNASEMLEAMDKALDFAADHGIEYVKFQVSSESI